MREHEKPDGGRGRPSWAVRGALGVGAGVLVTALLVAATGEVGVVSAASSSPGNSGNSSANNPRSQQSEPEEEQQEVTEEEAEDVDEVEDVESEEATEAADVPFDLEVPDGMPTTKPAVLGLALEPLSQDEKGYARFRALQTQESVGEQVDGSPGYEFLSVALSDPDLRDPQRIAEVVSYDYANDVTVFQYVDLATGEVEIKTSDLVSRPPSARETALAMEILIAAPEGEELRAQYLAYFGEELTSADDIRFTGGAYFAPAGSKGIAACATSRCVEFQVMTEDGRVLEPNVVVDLSAQLVRTFAN